MKKSLCIVLCIISALFMLSACGNQSNSSVNEPAKRLSTFTAEYETRQKAEAEVCRSAGLLWYSIDWGSTESEIIDDNTVKVELYGNISGYEDKEKVKYSPKRGFCVKATVTGTDDACLVENIRVEFT